MLSKLKSTNRESRLTILGLDPGLANLGYGLIEQDNQNLKFLKAGLIKTPPSSSNDARLLIIYRELRKIIKKYKPDKLASEELFFCKNVKTALVIGQVIGVILLTASLYKLPLQQFTPLEIKQSLTSYGRAEKKQLAIMVKFLLKLDKVNFPAHATDALACAICGAQTKSWTKN